MFKVGDIVYDLECNEENKRAEIETVNELEEMYRIRWESNGETWHVSFDDTNLIPEELYNSGLYKAMQEEDE